MLITSCNVTKIMALINDRNSPLIDNIEDIQDNDLGFVRHIADCTS